jgi:adenine deaminase
MENPALCYGLSSKGSLAVGKDADLIVADENLELLDVYAGGVALVRAGVVKLRERVSRSYAD